jgi:hypothetical protein
LGPLPGPGSWSNHPSPAHSGGCQTVPVALARRRASCQCHGDHDPTGSQARDALASFDSQPQCRSADIMIMMTLRQRIESQALRLYYTQASLRLVTVTSLVISPARGTARATDSSHNAGIHWQRPRGHGQDAGVSESRSSRPGPARGRRKQLQVETPAAAQRHLSGALAGSVAAPLAKTIGRGH